MKYLFKLKPFTVNKAYSHYCTKCRSTKYIKRYKSKDYKKYIKDINKLFDSNKKIPSKKIFIDIMFGFSSSLSDVDNPTKPLLDTMQIFHKFNDRDVFKLHLEKTIVKKGDEFIDLQILPYEDRRDNNTL